MTGRTECGSLLDVERPAVNGNEGTAALVAVGLQFYANDDKC